MKKLLYMVLCNLCIAIITLLSLYNYVKHMTIFSYILAAGLFGAVGVRAYLEEKIIKKEPGIKKEGAYKFTHKLMIFSLLILTIGVLYIRLK